MEEVQRPVSNSGQTDLGALSNLSFKIDLENGWAGAVSPAQNSSEWNQVWALLRSLEVRTELNNLQVGE